MNYCTLYVPAGSKVAYRKADVWKYFKNIIERSWTNLLVNGDASGEYGEVPCAMSKTGTKELSPADIEADGDNKVFAVHAGARIEHAWENQFWILAPRTFSKNEKVKVSFRYKAAAPATVTTETHGGPSEYLGWNCIGEINFTDEWQYYSSVLVVQYDGFQSIAFDLSNHAEANDYYFDDLEFCESTEASERPAAGTNFIANGDASGEYGEVPCAMSKTGTKKLSPADIETDGDNKVFAVRAGAKEANVWDNQFWIQSPYPFYKDEKVKISFRYKAAAPATVRTEAHGEPSEYLNWECIGDINFTDEWQYFSGVFIVQYDGFQSIAFDLSCHAEANDYYFDDIEICYPIFIDIDGLCYCVTSEEGKTAELTECNAGDSSIEIPSTVVLGGKSYTVTSIAPSAFEECHSLTSIDIPNTIEKIGERAFYGTSLKEVAVPELVTKISPRLFMGCKSLESAKIPGGVTKIGYEAFNSCPLLKSIDIPDCVTEISYGAFYDCSSLEAVAIPSQLTTIESGTFGGCASLTSIVLPSTMTTLEDGAFAGCTGLMEITSLAATPPSYGEGALYGPNKAECILYVPAKSVNAYRQAEGWKNFLNIKPIGNEPEIAIKKGWNWISAFLNEPVAVDKLFANGAKRVVGQTVESIDDPKYGVVGNLVEIEPGVGYKVYSDAEFTVSLSGVAVDVEEKPVALRKGWNWIGWPGYVAIEVKTAVGNAEEGDCIVSQDAFANYSGGAWSGTLKVLEPGRGYLYRSVSDKTLQFTFE